MNDKVTNILLVGVGGQGTLLASEILSETFMLAGFDVKKSEIHGMSQRGGSVVSHVRFGREVASPTVPEGEGDVLDPPWLLLLPFPDLEKARFGEHVKGSASDFVPLPRKTTISEPRGAMTGSPLNREGGWSGMRPESSPRERCAVDAVSSV